MADPTQTCSHCGTSLSPVQSGDHFCMNCFLEGGLEESFDTVLIGATLGHFEVKEKIGQGGMGEVYLARDTKLDRNVALQFLTPALQSDPTARIRILREAKAVAALDHPYICKIYETGEVEDLTFLALEYVDGETLEKHLDKGPLPFTDAIELAIEIAEALQEAHGRGIVHRDIKPSNIIVTHHGHAKLMDLGLARIQIPTPNGEAPGGDLTLTEPTAAIGSLPYMSPEQARGEEADTRSDVFSFGVLLYEMVAGERPFLGATPMAVLEQILTATPSRPDHLSAEVWESLEPIITKATEKDPKRRFPTAEELYRILRRMRAKGGGVRPVNLSSEHPLRPLKSLRKGTSIRRIAVLVTVLVCAMAGYLLRKASPPRKDIEEALPQSHAFRDRPSAISAESAQVAIAVLPFSDVDGSAEDRLLTSGLHSKILTSLSQIPDLRVIARRSVMRYADTEKSTRQIAEELGVNMILDGDVLLSGDRLRISAQLIDVIMDEQVWADAYTRELSVAALFELQRQIAAEIARALKVRFAVAVPEDLEEIPTEQLEAYSLYLRGLAYENRPGLSKTNREMARQSYQKAIEIDPKFALAAARLSLVSSGKGEGKSWQFANQALRLDPNLPEAHLALGRCLYFRGATDRAWDELEIAANGLPPGDSTLATYRAGIWLKRGNRSEAIATYERAVLSDPQNFDLQYYLGVQYRFDRRFADAVAALDKTIELVPDHEDARFVRGKAYLTGFGDTRPFRDYFDSLPQDINSSGLAIGRIRRINYFRWKIEFLDRAYSKAIEALNDLADDAVLVAGGRVFEREALRGITYYVEGERHTARTVFQNALAIIDQNEGAYLHDVEKYLAPAQYHMNRGIVLAGLGDANAAESAGLEALEISKAFSNQKSQPHVDFAVMLSWIYVLLDQPEAAAQQIDFVLSVPAVFTMRYLDSDPIFESIRAHSAWVRLRKKYR